MGFHIQTFKRYQVSTPLPHGYNRDSLFSARVLFSSITPNSPTADLRIPVENQQMIINCTDPSLAPWCQSCVETCFSSTALSLTPFLQIYYPSNNSYSEWRYDFGATLLNRFGVPGDQEFAVVDLARENHTWEYAKSKFPSSDGEEFSAEAVLFHDALLRVYDIAQCFTPVGGTCESVEVDAPVAT